MATTTTKTKKKLVYKQDPDGVFRLKKVNGDEVPESKHISSTDNLNKKQVDDYINELVDCSYKLSDGSSDADVTPDPSPVDIAVSHDPKPAKKRKSKQENRPVYIEPEAQEEFPKVTTTPVTSHSEDSRAFSFESLLTQFKMAPQETMTQIKRFHPQSFVLGVASALILYRLQPLIFHYGLIAINLAKYGLLWGIVLGAAGWYLGVVNVADLEQTIAKIKSKVSGAPAAIPVAEDSGSIYDEDSDEEMPEPSPTRAELYPKGDINPPIPPMERKNTLTSVTPFKHHHEPRYTSVSHHSTPDLHQHQNPKQPKLNRIHTTDARPKRPSPTFIHDRRRGSYPRHGLFDSAFSRQSPDKDLPVPPEGRVMGFGHDELPFINEVKLVNSYEMDEPEADIKRQNTTMSKKSVLGTRAKYNAFVANAAYDD